MDGDLGARGYSFASKFGESININNLANFNDKTIKIISDTGEFEKQIVDALRDGQNLFIPSMSNAYATGLKALLHEVLPEKFIEIYNSKQDDNIKESDMKDVLNCWSSKNLSLIHISEPTRPY